MKQDRDRLTITLRKDLLTQVDGIIDGVQIRNRSHAIEYLLTQSLGPQARQAVILAGGKGADMRPLTYEVPKALIPVKGKPVIEYTIETLRDAGVKDIIIAIGHMGDKIKEALGAGQKYGVRISYSEEHEPAGSAGALKLAQALIHSEPFWVVNGDILADINLQDIIEFHQDKPYIGTVVLTVAKQPKGYGSVQLRGDKILKFIKRASDKESHLVDAGIYLFDQRIFDHIPKNKPIDLEEAFAPMAKQGNLGGYLFEGKWFEVSTPENYEQAIKHWRGD